MGIINNKGILKIFNHKLNSQKEFLNKNVKKFSLGKKLINKFTKFDIFI